MPREQPYKFIGRAYDDDDRLAAQRALESFARRSLEPVTDELVKTANDFRIIEAVNLMLRNTQESLGIEPVQPLLADQIHLLPHTAFQQRFPSYDTRAVASTTEDAIYIDRNTLPTTAHYVATLLHEAVHIASYRLYYVNDSHGISDARVGYRLRSPWKSHQRREQFRAFNEFIVDLTVYMTLLQNTDKLTTLGITHESIHGSIYTYMHHADIVAPIVDRLAETLGVSRQTIIDDLIRGQFSRMLLSLKIIERVFGKGSLRILAALDTLPGARANDSLSKMIATYFETRDADQRNTLRREIMGVLRTRS